MTRVWQARRVIDRVVARGDTDGRIALHSENRLASRHNLTDGEGGRKREVCTVGKIARERAHLGSPDVHSDSRIGNEAGDTDHRRTRVQRAFHNGRRHPCLHIVELRLTPDALAFTGRALRRA